MNKDTSFSSKSRTFKNNIYGTSKGKVREAVMLRDLEHLVSKEPLRILDVGGGQGQIALELASKGHAVTITDISQEMLDEAKRRAEQLNLLDVEFIHGPLQDLKNAISGVYDLVLCHAVFEWLDEPKQALTVLQHFCRPGGNISLMFYNEASQKYANLIYGNFEYLDNGLKAKKAVKLNPQKGLNLETVSTWASELNLIETQRSGVRVFHDYMRDINFWQNRLEDILRYELEYSTKSPYLELARYIHCIYKNEGNES